MIAPPVHLVGHRFPGGTVRIPAHEAWLGHDAMDAPVVDGAILHPLWVLVIALRGMGLTIDALIGLAGATTSSGVLFGELGWEQRAALHVDAEYAVIGGITDVTRHVGKRAGVLDRLAFEVELRDPAAELAARMNSSFLLPRHTSERPGER